MARHRKHEDHVNHEAWAIPYGDLITLLLAFFVVMYALSSVNEGKYRVLSDSLVAAFRAAPKSLEPVQVGEPNRSQGSADVNLERTLVPLEIDNVMQIDNRVVERSREWEAMRAMGMLPEQIDETMADIRELTELIGKELEALVAADEVRLRASSFWLEIEINSAVLFPTASADLTEAAKPIVERLGQILGATDSRIQVEGHTDDVPIETPEFPSNWELSAGRAATVVRLFADSGVDPRRMAALGFGEYRPAAGNDTLEGRAANRRVVVVVTADSPSPDGERRVPSAEHVGDSAQAADAAAAAD
jgi:chemotaxis protein MotB